MTSDFRYELEHCLKTLQFLAYLLERETSAPACAVIANKIVCSKELAHFHHLYKEKIAEALSSQL